MEDLLQQFSSMNFVGQTFFVLSMAEGILLMAIYARRYEKQQRAEHNAWLNSPEGQEYMKKLDMSRTKPPGESM